MSLSSFSQLQGYFKFMIRILNNFVGFLGIPELMKDLSHGIFELMGNLWELCRFGFEEGNHFVEKLEGNTNRVYGIVLIKKIESVLLLDDA